MDTQNIEYAVIVLEENISSIFTVKEWAEEMGYSSEKYFSRIIRNHYGKRPKEVIKEVKLQAIKQKITNNPEEIFYAIAKELGFANDQALYKFVKRYTGQSLTSVKMECEKGV